jgi:hypothetical protein
VVAILNSQCIILWDGNLNWRTSVRDEHDAVFGQFGDTVKWSDNWLCALALACDNCASLDACTVFDLSLAAFELEFFGLASFWGNLNDIIASLFPSRDETRDSSNVSLTFLCTSLEKLLNTWKTARDSTRTSLTR